MASRLMNFRAAPDLAEAIEAAAERRMTTVSALVREAIIEKLKAGQPASLDDIIAQAAGEGFEPAEVLAGVFRFGLSRGLVAEATDMIAPAIVAVERAAAEAGLSVAEFILRSRKVLGIKAAALEGAAAEGATA